MCLILEVAGVSQIVLERYILFRSVIDCSCSLAVYGEDSANISFLCYHESVRRNRGMWGMWGDTEIGMVICGRIRMLYLCFTSFFEGANEIVEVTSHTLPTQYPSSK